MEDRNSGTRPTSSSDNQGTTRGVELRDNILVGLVKLCLPAAYLGALVIPLAVTTVVPFVWGVHDVPSLRATLRRCGWAGASYLGSALALRAFDSYRPLREEKNLQYTQTRAKWEPQLRALEEAYRRADELNDPKEKERAQEELELARSTYLAEQEPFGGMPPGVEFAQLVPLFGMACMYNMSRAAGGFVAICRRRMWRESASKKL